MKIQALTYGEPRDPREVKMPIYEAWVSFVNNFAEEKAPKGLQSTFIYAKNYWCFMTSE